MTAKYRIVPAETPNVYNVQKRIWFFVPSWFTVGSYGTLLAAEGVVSHLVEQDARIEESKLRSKSWQKAVPAVYYDENGKIID